MTREEHIEELVATIRERAKDPKITSVIVRFVTVTEESTGVALNLPATQSLFTLTPGAGTGFGAMATAPGIRRDLPVADTSAPGLRR